MLDRRLHLHLAMWLGQWPAGPGLHVVGSHRRARPAWDGRLRPAIAVSAGAGTVLSVPPDRVSVVRDLARGPARLLLPGLPAAVGQPGWVVHDDVFRWSSAPAPLPEVGEWIPPTAPGLPAWLRLFDRPVLVVRDDRGRFLAGVGVKRHDAYGRELAVGTAPAARNRGLARRLVAQAARRVLDEGGIPTYLHDRRNAASARVADAAGFPDRGWRSYGVYPS
ncbi:GNAT family N-acetyltransferase [Micromonospora endolithica]|uniref:GNAT family N-acetyltransferase n=1 Tax=Micromonospora endolithica TaxID=230091 RepID=A0A3A9ZPP8_9ACTN|nr:GNAT family N-acetyltransferase [Micromonospora endolithica]RKN49457.1 GNAT family N-acetyltransferase [Micromonospora endolithica]TWJ23658.1 acetyltransferase (GNAT) family protein [Micromonospora endolithica]